MNPSENRTTIFKLIVNGIELRAAFEERKNKQKNARFVFKNESYLSFSHTTALGDDVSIFNRSINYHAIYTQRHKLRTAYSTNDCRGK